MVLIVIYESYIFITFFHYYVTYVRMNAFPTVVNKKSSSCLHHLSCFLKIITRFFLLRWCCCTYHNLMQTSEISVFMFECNAIVDGVECFPSSIFYSRTIFMKRIQLFARNRLHISTLGLQRHATVFDSVLLFLVVYGDVRTSINSISASWYL